MDNRTEVREFLSSRRARLKPQQAGLPAYGLHRPVVGDLDLSYEAFELPADPGLRLLVYTAEPATPTADALRLLASWAATRDQAERTREAHATDEA